MASFASRVGSRRVTREKLDLLDLNRHVIGQLGADSGTGRFDEMAGVLGQAPGLPGILEAIILQTKRRALASRYVELLANNIGLVMPSERGAPG